jgi:hypothetical protein
MKTEIKTKDLLSREHLVSFNFTVRTNGYKCWKIYADVRSNGEKFVVEYQETEKIISGLLSQEVSEQKADYLFKNMPVKETNLIYNWLSDFPRYKIVDAENGSLLCEERTREGAEEMAESFYFVNTLIVDTWGI